MESNYILVNENDHVIVSLKNYVAGEKLNIKGREIVLRNDIPYGHKIALKEIKEGETINKYGYPIGKATKKISIGDWVHTHNVETTLDSTLDYQYQPDENKVKSCFTDKTFQGYVRENGEVGIRNEIWIINTVGCINKTAEILAQKANEIYKDKHIDGVYHFPHPFGCSQLGDDLHNTQKILRNLVHHPNAAGVLVLGLGCENNNISYFKKIIGEYEEDRVKFLQTQDVDDELEEGLERIEALVSYAQSFSREPVPISKLKVGLKCGGSDGFSGITANPLVGSFSDKLISYGGSTVLTEVPEMFGAETILMQRAENKEVFSKIVHLINDFKEYFIRNNQVVYENPSPGNKEGGITTLEEKSLGCVQKGGFARVVDVHPYGEVITKPGLNLLQGPGNDLVSVTALSASGAHIVLFTTGRGTPFGGPVPTVKISTNTSLYEKKKKWIDFNAGELVEGKDMNILTDELFDYIIKLASGEIKTRNEEYGFKEIAIFKDGVTL